MTRYTPDSRERVRDAVDMVALVTTRVPDLARKGHNSWFGRCPFHEERTGSFHVRPDDKHYHCFGCQASGDPFDFVMETEGIDFREALEQLAGRFGVELEREDEDPEAQARRERRERLLALLERTTVFYARYLWESREAQRAREYLAGRGLTEETLREFRVGYAPSAWDRVLVASRQAGYSEDELTAAGLLRRSARRPGQVYDAFRERIIFPLADARGRVLGFGARAMRDEQGAKYVNSAESDLFQKRSQLFGLDKARAHAARAGRMILVEGYTDVLALHQADVRNAVAVMGTSFTEEQARELQRTVKVVELALDADRAGEDAMLRAARLAADRGVEVRVVPLPAGSDPAELVHSDGVDALRELVGRSVPFVAFHVDRILERADTTSAEGKDRAIDELRPVLGKMPVSVLREELVRRAAVRLDLTEELTSSLIGGARRNGRSALPRPRAVAPEPQPIDQRGEAERAFLALCIAFPDEGAVLLGADGASELFSDAAARAAAAELAGHTADPLAGVDPAGELGELIGALAVRAERGRAGGRVVPENLEHAHLTLELARIERAIAGARADGSGNVTELSRSREKVRDRLAAVTDRLADLDELRGWDSNPQPNG